MTTYTTTKTYFRGNPKYGRTTILLCDGKEVLSVMGVVSKKRLVNQYMCEGIRQMMHDFDRAKAAGKIMGY